jgi:GNAT superfamily N-acetyltransferase
VVALRPATRGDLRPLVALTRRCAASHRAWAPAGDALPLPDEAAQELAWDLWLARAGAWVRVAEEDGSLVGALAFAKADDDPERLAHVSALFVDPDHWRRGIARTLLTAAEDAMRAAGFSRAQLWTLEGSPAERLYTALGWHRDGRRDVFTPMGLPTVAYVKAL